MSNERLKFRVWDNDRDIWVKASMSDAGRLFGDYRDDQYIIEQCTGTRDCNGKLIFEGDIIRLVENGIVKHAAAVVVWASSEISGAWICESTFELEISGRSKKTWCFSSAWEIIGNIHEKLVEVHA